MQPAVSSQSGTHMSSARRSSTCSFRCLLVKACTRVWSRSKMSGILEDSISLCRLRASPRLQA